MTQERKFATLIADGSWSEATKCGGWAARLIYDDCRNTWWGPLGPNCRSSQDAEIAAIGNALHFALKEQKLPHGTGVLVQSDNARVIAMLQDIHDLSFQRSVVEIDVLNFLREALREQKILWLLPRKIQAHLGVDKRAPRHHVHEAIDRQAKKGRKMAEAAQMKELNEQLLRKRLNAQSTTKPDINDL